MDHKRKRERQAANTTATTSNNDDHVDDDATFMQALISPDFEELSSHFPTFRRAYREVQQAQAQASASIAASASAAVLVATAANNDVNNSAESTPHHVSNDNKPANTCNVSSSSSLAACMTQEFSIALTRALLHLHFGIALTHLPLHHLCPPVPNRFFFIQWIQNDLLPLLFFDDQDGSSSSSSRTESSEPGNAHFVQTRPSRNCGLDIGTGATAIYPLLFAANVQRRRINSRSSRTDVSGQDQLFVIDGISNNNDNSNDDSKKKNIKNKKWTLYGTDTDPESIQLAKENVSSNLHCFQSTSTIHLLQVDPSDAQQKSSSRIKPPVAGPSSPTALSNWECHPVGPLRRFFQTKERHGKEEACHAGQNSGIDDSSMGHVLLDFCMTNPPFYDDNNDDKNASKSGERTNPRKGDGRARTSMTVSEGSYPNGEAGFVIDMILDGLVLYACQDNPGNQQQEEEEHGNSGSTSRHHHTAPLPPGWSCCMCGKKASWVRLQHVVTQLLGPGHVMATEFGPGHLTRWFLAWTFQQPQMQSPLARMEGCSFVVNVDIPVASTPGQGKDAFLEVMNRLDEYCRSLPGWDLALTPVSQTRAEIREVTPAPKWIDDGLLPASIRNVLAGMDPAKRMNMLPPGGHFLLDVQLEMTSREEQGTGLQVAVHVNAFQHSTHGKKTVGKITSQLEGEICRTNRRWRRKLKRQEDEEHQSQQPLAAARDEGPQPMDES